MEALGILEKKIASLIELLGQLRDERARLVEEKAQLVAKLDLLESSLLTDSEHIEKLNQEKALTKTVVDDLIKSIDLLVEEKQL